MWMRIANNSCLAYIPKTLAYYRMHNDNTSSKLELMMESRFQIIEKWKLIYPEIHKKALKYWRTQALVQFAKNNKNEAKKYLKFNWDYLTDKKYRKYLIKFFFSKRF
jgi:hypothetical protein